MTPRPHIGRLEIMVLHLVPTYSSIKHTKVTNIPMVKKENLNIISVKVFIEEFPHLNTTHVLYLKIFGLSKTHALSKNSHFHKNRERISALYPFTRKHRKLN